jgi:hypothetical protein
MLPVLVPPIRTVPVPLPLRDRLVLLPPAATASAPLPVRLATLLNAAALTINPLIVSVLVGAMMALLKVLAPAKV